MKSLIDFDVPGVTLSLHSLGKRARVKESLGMIRNPRETPFWEITPDKSACVNRFAEAPGLHQQVPANAGKGW